MDNQEVLAAENSMQGWLSLFRYLIKAEERGDTRAPNPALMEFAARARTSAFTTPLRDHTKRAHDDGEEASESSHSRGGKSPDFTALQDAIMGVQGELGVRVSGVLHGPWGPQEPLRGARGPRRHGVRQD